MLKKSSFLIVMFAIIMSMASCKMGSEEEVLETQKFKITYDAAGHGTAPEAKTVESGYKLTAEDLPALTENGFTFGGWRLGEKTVAAGEEVTADITLKANWTEWGKVAKPAFSVTDSAVDYGDTIVLSCETSGADIYYTTDGTTPTSASTKYTSPVSITGDVTIKAIALKSGMNDSAVSEKAYTIKKYTITFDANGHGTAPEPVTDKHKGETVTLPAALIETGYLFEKWNDGTTDYAAGAEYTVTGDITIKALWKEIKNVTNLTATCNASGTVKLIWENPTDADFAKVVITYGTSESVTVLKTANPNNEATIEGLTDGTEYTFTVKAYDEGGNASSGVNKKCTPFLGTVYNATNKGGLEGYTNQTQGDVIKESWMADNGNLKVDGTEIAKTSEVVVIPTGTVATVTMPDDSSWNRYYNGSNEDYKGVFLKNRNVKLDSFVMSQYEVTQKLYSEVMGENPSFSRDNPATGETQENRPVESVSWYKACAFCNELTKKTFGETTDQCVYYSDEQCTTPYTISNANSRAAVYAAYNTETKKWTKKGYRLPTEAEWEFAARGGDPNALDGEYKSIWSYAYAGVQTEKQPENFTSGGNDDKLGAYGWYNDNSDDIITHEVGLKEKNKLNLYDMSGNVHEWCYDKSGMSADSDDSAYTVNGYVQNPVGASSSGSRYCRGGNYMDTADGCSVSFRGNYVPSECEDFLGFRLVRSTN